MNSIESLGFGTLLFAVAMGILLWGMRLEAKKQERIREEREK